jgi:hypothetical protein
VSVFGLAFYRLCATEWSGPSLVVDSPQVIPFYGYLRVDYCADEMVLNDPS